MMRSLLSMLLLFSAVVALSQTSHGNWLLGGSGGLSLGEQDRRTTSVSLAPLVGRFVQDNVAIGSGAELYYLWNRGDLHNSWGVSPFGRLYLADIRMSKLFFHAQLGFGRLSYKSTSSGSASSSPYFALKFGPGLAVFLNNSVALETQLRYSHLKLESIPPAGNIDVLVGLQIYLYNNNTQ